MNSRINTFIVGAQKAGTTSIYDWLSQHPDIDAPQEIKDYHFFNYDENFNKGIKYLEGFYKKNSKINIHCAVNYMYFGELSAKRIYNYNPDAKIIICLRNPINRAISAYKYFVRILKETNSFSEALQKEINGELKSFLELSNNTYIEHGFYYDQIQTYLKYFSREQIHFVFFEELVDSSKQESLMNDVLSFLNIQTEYHFSFQQLNASGVPKSKLLNYIKHKTIFPKLFKPFLPFSYRRRLSKRIEELNISDKNIEVDVSYEDKELLFLKLKEQTNKLKLLLNSEIIKNW